MDLKLPVFKIILIFNVVAVYSMSCNDLPTSGEYKKGDYSLIINHSSRSSFSDNNIKVRIHYGNSYLNHTHSQWILRECITQTNGISYLTFGEPHHIQMLNITHWLIDPSLCSLTQQLSKCTL